MRRPIRLCAVSLLRQGFPRSPMISQSLYPAALIFAVGEYEWIAGAKVNFDKSEGLQLGAWRGSVTVTVSLFRGYIILERRGESPTTVPYHPSFKYYL